MARTFLTIVALSGALFSARPAAAQARSVLILPWSVDEADPATLAARAETVAGALSSGELTALALEDARTRFEEHGSAEPPSVTDSEVDQWLALSRLAVRHLAHADYAAARQTLLEAQALSERAAAELNREEARARQVLDTCLYEVRAYVETSDPRAASRAMECRRLVPRIAPSTYQHTPEVVELLTRVDRELAAAAPGSLRLGSEPAGCSVRLNGIELGTTPFVSADLATGEYRVQVECGGTARGRVHRIRLGEGESAVSIDTRFDAVVRTDTVLRLAYANVEEAEERRLGDAVGAASVVGAGEVWLLSLEAGDVVRIDRVLVGTETPLASTRANALTGLGAAVASLARGQSEDRTGERVVPLARWRGGATEADAPETAAPSASGWGRADWEIGLGAAAGAVAIAGLAAGFALADDGYRLGLASSAYPLSDPMYLRSRDTWQAQRSTSWALSMSGGALGVLAVVLAMEREASVPWWSWAVGGVGLGAAVTGAVLTATATECGTAQPAQPCIAGAQQRDFGVSALGLSLPLLAVPLTFLLRDATGSAVTPSVEVTREQAMVHVGGVW